MDITFHTKPTLVEYLKELDSHVVDELTVMLDALKYCSPYIIDISYEHVVIIDTRRILYYFCFTLDTNRWYYRHLHEETPDRLYTVDEMVGITVSVVY
jgi:hypothetical protein